MLRIIGIISFILSLSIIAVIFVLVTVEQAHMALGFLGVSGFIFPYYFYVTGIFDKTKTVQDQLDIETNILEKKIEIQKIIRELEELENEN